MSLNLAVFTEIIIKHAYNYFVVRLEKFFNFIILFTIENFVNFPDSIFKILISVSNNNDMRSFIIFEDVFLLFVGATTSDTDFALGPFLNNLLSFALGADNLTNVVGFGVIHGRICEEDLLELLQRLVIIRGHESVPHLHTVLDKTDTLSVQLVSFPHLVGVDPAPVLVVYGLRTRRLDIGVVGGKVVNLGGQLVQPVKS